MSIIKKNSKKCFIGLLYQWAALDSSLGMAMPRRRPANIRRTVSENWILMAETSASLGVTKKIDLRCLILLVLELQESGSLEVSISQISVEKGPI